MEHSFINITVVIDMANYQVPTKYQLISDNKSLLLLLLGCMQLNSGEHSLGQCSIDLGIKVEHTLTCKYLTKLK